MVLICAVVCAVLCCVVWCAVLCAGPPSNKREKNVFFSQQKMFLYENVSTHKMTLMVKPWEFSIGLRGLEALGDSQNRSKPLRVIAGGAAVDVPSDSQDCFKVSYRFQNCYAKPPNF